MADKNGQFYGVGLNKAGRRKNRPNGSPRKMYAYTRKAQRGTPLEDFINSNYADLDEQWNAAHDGPGRMDRDESTGGLNNSWTGVRSDGISGRAIREYQRKHGGTAAMAKKALVGLHQVSFGADPKSR